MGKVEAVGNGNDVAGKSASSDSITGITIVEPPSTGSGGSGGGDTGGSDTTGGTAKPAPRKRATPRKRAPAKKKDSGIVGIEKILMSLHLMASSALKIEELALDQQEADTLAEAVKEVASHYDISPDPKVIAWAGLIGVATSIYAPRVMAYKMRVATEKREKPKQQPAQQPEVTQHDPTAHKVEELPISPIS